MKTNISTPLGVIRHHCPLPDCGWFHDVDLSAEPLPPILLPAAAFDVAAFRVTDSVALSDVISAAAEKQHRELAERAGTAMREHAEGHGVLEYVRALAEAAKREHLLQQGEIERSAMLEECRDLLESAGHNGAHSNDWPEVAPALRALVAERDRLSAKVEALEASYGQVAADAMAHGLCHMRTGGLINRAEAAEARVQAITEATVMWRDRPGGDVGLAIALAGILDTEQSEPPASAALVRVLSECDRIEREVYGQHDEDDDGMREAVRRIRAAATEPLTRTALDTAGETS
jgi:hypothetical protein